MLIILITDTNKFILLQHITMLGSISRYKVLQIRIKDLWKSCGIDIADSSNELDIQSLAKMPLAGVIR